MLKFTEKKKTMEHGQRNKVREIQTFIFVLKKVNILEIRVTHVQSNNSTYLDMYAYIHDVHCCV